MNQTTVREAAAWSRRLRASDPDVLGELFDRYHHGLYRYASGFVGTADAGDVVQEIFLSLWEKRRSTTVRASIAALLYTMARNRCLNHLRKHRHEELTWDFPDREAVDDGSDRELERNLHSWIAGLPPRRAEAFLLSRYHDLSHDQISRIMGLSLRTVQTHIVHALRDLRKHLDTWNRDAIAAELP